MKLKTTFLSTALCAIISLSSASADVKEAARKLHDESGDALVGIKALLKIEVTRGGQPAGGQEVPVWGNGTVIGDGLIATSYSTLIPDVAAQAPGGALPAGVQLNTKLNEVKFVNGSGEEFDGKLILHDEDLDLAFLAIDPQSDTAADWKIGAVDIAGDADVQLLDDLIGLTRYPSTLRFATELRTGEVTAKVERPRLMYAVRGLPAGSPAFTDSGSFLGMVVMRKAATKKEQSIPIVLPAKYLRKLVPQAVEKQAALKDAPAEEAKAEEATEEPAAKAEEAAPKEEAADSAPATEEKAEEAAPKEESASEE